MSEFFEDLRKYDHFTFTAFVLCGEKSHLFPVSRLLVRALCYYNAYLDLLPVGCFFFFVTVIFRATANIRNTVRRNVIYIFGKIRKYVTGQIYSYAFFFECKKLARCEFGNVRKRRNGICFFGLKLRKHIDLTFDRICRNRNSRIDKLVERGKQRTALFSETVERSGFYECLKLTLIQHGRIDARNKISDRFISPVIFPARNNFIDGVFPDVLYCKQTESDGISADVKIRPALVYVRRKNGNSAAARFTDIFGDFSGRIRYRCEKRAKILFDIVAFQICRSERQDRICRRVAFVESVICKSRDVVEKPPRSILGYAALKRTRNKAVALCLKHRGFFL